MIIDQIRVLVFPHLKIGSSMHLYQKWSLVCLHEKMSTDVLHQRWALVRFTNNDHRCTITKYEHRRDYTKRWAPRIYNNILRIESNILWSCVCRIWKRGRLFSVHGCCTKKTYIFLYFALSLLNFLSIYVDVKP
jgi:hypothetical protein